MASTVRGCGASAASPSDLGDTTASSQGGSPIKTTGGAPLRIGRSLVCRPVGLATVRGCGASAASPSDLGDATASSQGGSPIKTTGGTLLHIGRSPLPLKEASPSRPEWRPHFGRLLNDIPQQQAQFDWPKAFRVRAGACTTILVHRAAGSGRAWHSRL
ncbi:hypothetical protein BC826DRAFT_1112902 [Russula brevipes]|nr:hypothetical protein BC826DRAFT_1112902 [Russula brevipes]